MFHHGKTKIVFLSRNLEIGGMEKALVSLLNALAQNDNYSITLILENKSGPLLCELNESIIVKEYKLCNCKFTLLRKIINFSHRILWTLLNFNKFMFSCNYATYSVLGSKLARIASKNSAVYIHSNYIGFYENNIIKAKSFFESIDIRKFKNVIFVSKESQQAVEQIFPELSSKFVVINNIINKKEILNKANAYTPNVFDNTKINILFVGRLDDTSKNFKLLIEGFKKANEQNANLRLYIIGDGADKDMIEEFIESISVNNIIFLGEMENPYPYIKMCDSMILTSKYEGYPVVYTEALILNKQFITTVPVCDDFIDVRDYFSVIEAEPRAVADAILQINKNSVNHNLDIELINKTKIEKIEKIILMEL